MSNLCVSSLFLTELAKDSKSIKQKYSILISITKCVMKLNAHAEFIFDAVFTDSGLLVSVGVLLQTESCVQLVVLD